MVQLFPELKRLGEGGRFGEKKQALHLGVPIGSEMPLRIPNGESGKMVGLVSLESRGDVWAVDIHLEAISIWVVFKGTRLNEII